MKIDKLIRIHPLPKKKQGVALIDIMKEPVFEDYRNFFQKIGFESVIYVPNSFKLYWKIRSHIQLPESKRKEFNDHYLNMPILTFRPLNITWESSTMSRWSGMDERYKRDNWGNSEMVKVDFEYIIADKFEFSLMRKRNVVMKLNPRVLSSARIVVYSRSEYDRHPYATLYLDPTNSYTYAEWKDTSHVERAKKVDYKLFDNGTKMLRYFLDHMKWSE